MTKAPRWDALDLFRFAAVMLMVQGHTWYVVVDQAIRPERWYRWHNYVHGYTAPMFMFASGLAFGVTTFRRWDDHAYWGRPVLKRIERYLMIIGVGYLLHLPSFSMASLDGASIGALRNFLKVDALQVIGVTLIGAELLIVAVKRRGLYVTLVSAIALGIVALAPWVHRLPVDAWLHPAFAGYLNSTTGSPFPLFPWAGFMGAGIVTAFFVQHAFDTGNARQLMGRLTAAGAALMSVALLAGLADISIFGEHNFWKTNPIFFMWRVGVLLIVVAVFTLVAEALGRRGAPGPVRKTIQVMGMETLVIYVAHLLVLYGTPLNDGINHSVGEHLAIPQATLAVVVLFAAMTAFAWGWHLFKKRRPAHFFWMRMAMLTTLLGWVFLSH